MKIIGKPKGEINVKRFYISGVKITGKCCHCDENIYQDLDGDGISYPLLNKDYIYTLICDNCQESMWVNLKFKLTEKVTGLEGENVEEII